MHRWSPVVLAQETTALMLLVHTVAITLYLWIGFILLKALALLRRTGERPAGFLAIVLLILLTSFARAVWLVLFWLGMPPPPWLDLMIICLVYVSAMCTPIILSAFYLPISTLQGNGTLRVPGDAHRSTRAPPATRGRGCRCRTARHSCGGEHPLRLGTEVDSVSGHSGDSVTLRIRTGTEEEVINGTHILVAAGRLPNTDGIGLERTSIERTSSGHIKVNASLQTTAEGVYAVGDCAGSPHFTHIASDDYRIVERTVMGESASTTGRQVPYTLFTDPELAHIGLHENEAKRQGLAYRLLKLPVAAVLRTRTLGETAGFLKALVASDDCILGFTALGVGAGELLAPVQLVMTAGQPYTAIRDLIVTHPTMTEGLVYLFSSKPTT